MSKVKKRKNKALFNIKYKDKTLLLFLKWFKENNKNKFIQEWLEKESNNNMKKIKKTK